MAAGQGPEGWAIKLTKMLDLVYGDGPERYPVKVDQLALEYSARAYPNAPIKKVLADDLDGFEGALVPAQKSGAWGIF